MAFIYDDLDKNLTNTVNTENKTTNTSGFIYDDLPKIKQNNQAEIINNNVQEMPKQEPQPTLKIEGGITKNVRRYEDRFPDRSKNFIGNTFTYSIIYATFNSKFSISIHKIISIRL